MDLIQKLGGDSSALTTSQAQRQIRYILGNQKITKKQRKLVASFPKQEIDTILHRDVVIEEITRFELKRIINTLYNKHNLCPKVYNHPIISTSDYEYGWQESNKCPDNKMYYIVFYDFLMVDIDDNDIDISALDNIMTEMNIIGRLYKTYNGYHIFVTSNPYHHQSKEAKYIMKRLNCDLFYSTFSYLNGFKVRLNPKTRPDELIAAEYIGVVGSNTDKLENRRLQKLLLLHDNFIEKHKIII